MRILLAIDGSEHSHAAQGTLARRPWPRETAVRVLSVVPPPQVFPGPEPGLALHYGELIASQTEEARRLVASTADTLERTGLAVDTAVREGDPRTEIVREALEWHADLILVGSHGRTGVRRWLLGSVAESVVRHAPCSVEVARP